MRLMFQKRPQKLWGRLICWWTGGPYFHVGIAFADNLYFEAIAGAGVRVGVVESFDPKHWDAVEVPLTDADTMAMQHWLASELGCGYDWLGLWLAQVLGINRESRTKWFCSELAVAALQKVGKFYGVRPCAISPNALAKMVK
jgi:hypothetical protein